MQLDSSDIVRITREACSMFGLELEGPVPAVDWAESELVSGRIDIEGAWRGEVAMGASSAFAVKLAELMFEMDPSEMSEDEIRDAFGELVNMTTGQIKAMLPEGCRMGLPTVGACASTELDLKGAEVYQAFPFQSEGEPLTLVVKRAS